MKALILLALAVLAGAMIFGATLTEKKPFESSLTMYSAFATATRNALDARKVEVAFGAFETPQAFEMQLNQTATVEAFQETRVFRAGNIQAAQTRQVVEIQRTTTAEAVSVQATMMAVRRNATREAVNAALDIGQANATQTALFVGAQNHARESEATKIAITAHQTADANAASANATTIAQRQAREQEESDDANTRENWIAGGIVLGIVGLVAVCASYVVLNGRTRAKEAEARVLVEQRRLLQVEAEIKARLAERKPGAAILSLPARQIQPAEDLGKDKAA